MSKVDFPLLIARAVRHVVSSAPSAVAVGAVGKNILRPDNTAGPVAAFVDGLLQTAVEQEASDIHIEPSSAGEILRIRLRVDGFLRPVPGIAEPVSAVLLPNIINRLKVMSHLDTTERRLPQDGRFSFVPEGAGETRGTVDVRVSVIPVLCGEKAVLRLLNLISARRLESLDLSPANEEILRRWCRLSGGLVLVTGPVGSGKTTTLYGVLSELDADTRNIVTVEDPVECAINGINQMAADEDYLTFPRALRSVLRQDPDVVLVGEIRDEETAEIAVRAALTGRLILSTLHTADSVGVVTRLLEMGIKPYLLAATLAGAMGQRLLRRLCPHCREKYIPAEGSAEAEFIKKAAGNDEAAKGAFYRAVTGNESCPVCGGSGYHGRIPIHELLPVNNEFSRAIVRGADGKELREIAAASGFKSMAADGVAKAAGGLTTIAEVERSLYGMV
ncbi:MAG: type II/IV secretion system protein [Schwartzia sp.]|nr:type II/IV secretion system protein [Schwartzia sp. (in: firmicutes)]